MFTKVFELWYPWPSWCMNMSYSEILLTLGSFFPVDLHEIKRCLRPAFPTGMYSAQKSVSKLRKKKQTLSFPKDGRDTMLHNHLTSLKVCLHSGFCWLWGLPWAVYLLIFTCIDLVISLKAEISWSQKTQWSHKQCHIVLSFHVNLLCLSLSGEGNAIISLDWVCYFYLCKAERDKSPMPWFYKNQALVIA